MRRRCARPSPASRRGASSSWAARATTGRSPGAIRRRAVHPRRDRRPPAKGAGRPARLRQRRPRFAQGEARARTTTGAPPSARTSRSATRGASSANAPSAAATPSLPPRTLSASNRPSDRQRRLNGEPRQVAGEFEPRPELGPGQARTELLPGWCHAFEDESALHAFASPARTRRPSRGRGSVRHVRPRATGGKRRSRTAISPFSSQGGATKRAAASAAGWPPDMA